MKRLLTPLLLFLTIHLSAQQDNFLWAKDIAIGNVTGTTMVLDSDGNIYTAGGFFNGFDFDPGPDTLPLPSTGTGFISKLDPSGNLLWVKQISGTNEQPILSMCVDFYQNVYLTGWFNGTADFDPGPNTYNLTSTFGQSSCYILKLDANGNFVWAQSLASGSFNSASIGNSIACDYTGMNIYVTGQFSDTISFFSPMFGPIRLGNSIFDTDCFIAHLDAQGNAMWAKKIGDVNNDFGSAICVDNSGDVVVSGYFIGTVDFDPGPGIETMSSGANSNAFALKLHPWGDLVWARNIGDASNACEHITSVFAGNGDVLVTGNFEGTTDFDPGIAVYNMSCPYHDGFLLKLDANGDFVWARQFGDATNGQDIVRSVVEDGAGNCYLTGDFEQSIDFDPGAGVYNLTAISSYDAFISKTDINGNFIWAKQLGGNGVQRGYAIQLDVYNSIFTMGNFQSTVDFNTDAGVYNLTGSQDVYIHKMGVCIAPQPPQNVTGNLNICKGDSLQLTVSGSGLISWYATTSDTIALQYGSSYTAAYDTTTTLYVQDSTCSYSLTRTAVTVTVNIPQVSISGPDTICYGEGFSLSASGAQSYIWSSGGTGSTEQVMPLSNTTYTVVGTDAYNCSDTANIDIFVYPAIDVSVVLNGTTISANNNNASYQWIDCSNPWNITDTNQTYEPWANGDYEVIVYEGSCYDTSVCVTVAGIGLKNEWALQELRVFPNPGTGQFIVYAMEAGSISILNVLGEMVLRKKVQEGKNEIDLSAFPDGVYLLKQEGRDREGMIRLVKTN
jgi:hypothetical protein